MNRFSNVEGIDYGSLGTFIPQKPRPISTTTPRFDGGDTCDDLELSNFSALDSNVKNMVSKEIFDYNFSGNQTKRVSPKVAPRLDYNADGTQSESTKDNEVSVVKPASINPSVSDEKRILGMRPKLAYGLGAAFLIGASAFVYFKYIKK